MAITFDPSVTGDGLGSQLHRLLGAYTVAACTQLPYIHTAGFKRFTHMSASEARHTAKRLNVLLGLPDKHLTANSSYKVVTFGRDCNITWDNLVAEVRAALNAKQPTLIAITFTYGFVLAHPAMLDCVPAFRKQVSSTDGKSRPSAAMGHPNKMQNAALHIWVRPVTSWQTFTVIFHST